jgi:hypothetical protein
MFSLYKPNSKNTGCAFAFKEGVTGKNYEPCVYVNGIQQHSWNETTKNGSFSENAKNPEKIIAFKLNEFELGGLINAIENRVEYKAFHTFDENKTVINFKPYTKQDGTLAYSLSVAKNSTIKFGVGIEVGEAYVLREFCKNVLHNIFEFRYKQNQASKNNE